MVQQVGDAFHNRAARVMRAWSASLIIGIFVKVIVVAIVRRAWHRLPRGVNPLCLVAVPHNPTIIIVAALVPHRVMLGRAFGHEPAVTAAGHANPVDTAAAAGGP